MPGDYSRKLFDRKKHYSGVLMEQGRVQLDADFNEQLDIQQYRTQTEATDVIGRCGVPKTDDGFRITATPDGRDLTISPGRIYVGGLLCELDTVATYTEQPYYPRPVHTNPIPPSSPPGPPNEMDLDPGTYLAFIEAWQRELTALDDHLIREVALGGPDHTARLQTVWQVKLLQLSLQSPPPSDGISCEDQFEEFEVIIAPTTGLMNARTQAPDSEENPCLLPPTAGYQRLENQLYRVEVHTGGSRAQATFKWSRDNATVESTIESIAGNIVTVADLGKDEILAFAGGQWVEIVDPQSELQSSPRNLVQIDTIDAATREITMRTSVAAFAGIQNAKLRRWDQSGTSATAGGVRVNLAEWIELEGGVQVSFSQGAYRAGDYWLIPARTATGEIEWPPFENPNTNPIAQSPVAISRHYCKLALIEVDQQGVEVISDCRSLFPPLTKLTQLHYVGGDGQEGPPGEELPHPIQVAVVNGSFPVVNARVRFRITAGNGNLTSGSNTGPEIVVRTGSDGVAECRWRLGTTVDIQRVEATLESEVTTPVRFNASFEEEGIQPGVHINRVRLRQRELRNDTNVTPEELIGGIIVDCDRNVDGGSLVQPTCFVTIDLPFPFNNIDRQLWGNPVIGFQPVILAGNPEAGERSIVWLPAGETQSWLARLLTTMSEFGRGDRALAHFTLKGNFIWDADDPNRYLDGEAFGFRQRPVPGGPTPAINIRFPTGDGRRGGDFEMWFWLTRAVNPVPNIVFTPPVLNFATTPATGRLSVSVSNGGTAPLTVTQLDIDNPAFIITSAGPPFTIAPGGQQAITIQFQRTATTQQTGTLRIRSNDPDQETVRVDLTGPPVAQTPNITVSSTSIDFDQVLFPSTQGVSQTLTVRNTGNGPLVVSSIRSSAAFFRVSPTAGFTLAPGAQRNVTVSFTPTRLGPHGGALTINSNDPEQRVVTVAMSGTGVRIIT